MTFSEDLNMVDNGEEFDAASTTYPVVFGITFTPKIIGIIVGVLGILGAGYIIFNMIMPAWETYQQQQAKQTSLQGEIEQKKANLKQIDKVKKDLALSKEQQKQVLGLFANEKTLDTLLFDLNRLIDGNTQISANSLRARLRKFVPASQKAEPITDGSLGTLVDGKLKRRSVNIEIIGTYEQTQSILRNIERLQPLLIVKNYDSSLAPEPPIQVGKELPRIGPASISTLIQLQALMPLNPEEVAQANQAAAKKK
ncbi:pilus assembly protein PilO [Iningainema tapete]|uniref:Pilus assembly protein PilO n=1 Tax=Iningainema tapete BLCC-T55 TaxID=2748662 RepID=A0A8J6XUK0_9CYAN|nr:pilus assembly protein PilO [Iningainema tapete]MBD2778819.1 pilus assembly protein PilO [Iningainema tapete BLCC-T55]